MAFDGIVTRAVIRELKETLTGLKVDKIYQVENDEIIIYFRKNRLLISSSGNNPRIYLTETKKENPKKPPLFSMVLRKHLTGATLKDIEQFGNDRVLRLKFDAWNEFSEQEEKSLIVEIMGRHSNIILVDKDDIIIDSIKHVSDAMSRVRQVLPNKKYEYIPDERKIDPISATKEEIIEKIHSSEQNKSISNAIFNAMSGFSKNLGIEVAIRAHLDSDRSLNSLNREEFERLTDALYKMICDIKNSNFEYKMYLDGDKIVEFHVLNLENLNGFDFEEFETPSTLLDKVYFKRDLDDRISQKSGSLKRLVNAKISKDKSKLSKLEVELSEAEDREKYKLYADVLSANFHKVKPGQREIVLENFYDENLEKITIPLDEKISAPQNAQKLYKKYAKLKNAEELVSNQIFETKSEIEYLESVLTSIELSEDGNDIDEIKEELISEGFIRRNRNKKNTKKNDDKDFKIYEKNGFEILLGRNNRENEIITHKIAGRDDLWFHIKGIPGSHVIIKTNGRDVPKDVIEYAAKIAAYNSKARNSGDVEIDYTKKKFVKRHPSGKPGLVNYTNFNTVSVSSNKE